MTTAARYPIALRRFAVAAVRLDAIRATIDATPTYDPATLRRLNVLAQRALRYSAVIRSTAAAVRAGSIPANLATIARLRDAVRARADARDHAAYPH